MNLGRTIQLCGIVIIALATFFGILSGSTIGSDIDATLANLMNSLYVVLVGLFVLVIGEVLSRVKK